MAQRPPAAREAARAGAGRSPGALLARAQRDAGGEFRAGSASSVRNGSAR